MTRVSEHKCISPKLYLHPFDFPTTQGHFRFSKFPSYSNCLNCVTMGINTPYVTLNDGNKMPQVGFGLWKVDNATCADTVYNAIKTGYRLFDGACGT